MPLALITLAGFILIVNTCPVAPTTTLEELRETVRSVVKKLLSLP